MSVVVRRFLFAPLALAALVAVTRPAEAQSFSSAATPATPILMNSASFISGDDVVATLDQNGAMAPKQKHHEGLGIGIKGGPFFAGLSGGDEISFENKAGFQVSLFLGGNRPGVFGVATEITFIKRNAQAAGSTTTSNSQYALEIPLLFRFNFGSKNLDRLSFYAMFGPALDLNLTKFSFSDLTHNTGYDLNLVFAGGVEITRFIVEVRYDKGLRSITSDLGDFSKVKTHAVVLLFGVRFN
jgi:hypothetical protein